MSQEAYEGLFNIDITNNVFTLTPEFDKYLEKNCKDKEDRGNVRKNLMNFYGDGKKLGRIENRAIGNKILREVELACAQQRISLQNQTGAFKGLTINPVEAKSPVNSTPPATNDKLQKGIASTPIGKTFMSAYNLEKRTNGS